MTGLLLMLVNAASYTICTLNDKRTVSEGSLRGVEFTFLVSASTAFFMLICVPFLGLSAAFCPQTFLCTALLTADKLGEFYACAVLLSVMPAFEIKAWLGFALFLSYASDCLFFGESFDALKLACLPLTCAGLALIISDTGCGKNRTKRFTPKIVAVLSLYIFSKYAYGLIMKAGEPYLTKNTGLFISMILLSLLTLIFVYPRKKNSEKPETLTERFYLSCDRRCDYKTFRKNLAKVFFTRIPNIAGLLTENILIGISLTLYSFVQPVILVALFFISAIKEPPERNKNSARQFAGGLICIVSIVLFELK